MLMRRLFFNEINSEFWDWLSFLCRWIWTFLLIFLVFGLLVTWTRKLLDLLQLICKRHCRSLVEVDTQRRTWPGAGQSKQVSLWTPNSQMVSPVSLFVCMFACLQSRRESGAGS